MTARGLYATSQWKRLRAEVLARAKAENAPCPRCGQEIDFGLSGRARMGPTVDHLIPVAGGGDELPDVSLLAVSHLHCNSRHGGEIRGLAGKRPKPKKPRRSRRESEPPAPAAADGWMPSLGRYVGDPVPKSW